MLVTILSLSHIISHSVLMLGSWSYSHFTGEEIKIWGKYLAQGHTTRSNRARV